MLASIASTGPAGLIVVMSGDEASREVRLEADVEAVAERRDRAAFGRVFAHYGPRVKAYLRRLGASDPVAEDLTQEVMLTVWRRAGQFDRTRAALSTWIYTIARNKRIDPCGANAGPNTISTIPRWSMTRRRRAATGSRKPSRPGAR